MESTSRSTTKPEKCTTPAAGAYTEPLAAMSIPRCPAEYAVAGAMYGRRIWCAPCTGQAHRGSDAAAGAAGAAGSAGAAGAAGVRAPSTRPTSSARRSIHLSCRDEAVARPDASELHTKPPKCGRWGSGATLVEASRAIRMTTRVRYPISAGQTAVGCTQPPSPSQHPRIELVEIVWPCADTRFRTTRCG